MKHVDFPLSGKEKMQCKCSTAQWAWERMTLHPRIDQRTYNEKKKNRIQSKIMPQAAALGCEIHVHLLQNAPNCCLKQYNLSCQTSGVLAENLCSDLQHLSRLGSARKTLFPTNRPLMRYIPWHLNIVADCYFPFFSLNMQQSGIGGERLQNAIKTFRAITERHEALFRNLYEDSLADI